MLLLFLSVVVIFLLSLSFLHKTIFFPLEGGALYLLDQLFEYISTNHLEVYQQVFVFETIVESLKIVKMEEKQQEIKKNITKE